MVLRDQTALVFTKIRMYNLNLSNEKFKNYYVFFRNDLNMFIVNEYMVYKVPLVESNKTQWIQKNWFQEFINLLMKEYVIEKYLLITKSLKKTYLHIDSL